MERRIDITDEQYRKIWDLKKNCKYKSNRDNKKLGDYFVMTTCNKTMILFDTIKEAREFNKSVERTFKTQFFPQDE